MRRFQRGFTVAELLFVIVWLSMVGGVVYILVLVARALLKYIGG
jgi:Tfp pilus assembly protein FimT